MALSSWNALYTHIEQKFMLKRQWRQLNLLRVLCHHADCFGLCYPGEDRIKAFTGIGTTAQLNEHLQFLVDGEYVKVWETWNQRRRGYDRDFQVSPFVMYVREELQGYAERVWLTGERDFDHESAIVIKLNGQPSSESESESSSDNHHQNHHHHPANKSAKRMTTGTAPDYANQADRPKQRRRRPTGTVRSTEKESAGRPPAPDKPDLRKYRSPLPQDEDHAQDIKLMFNMRITQARSLVATYGPQLVATAAAGVQDAINRGACSNPAGLLTYLLRRGGTSPEDAKPAGKTSMADETARLEAYQD